ncbi:YciI family protein [Bacillus cytotoxicus]|uniref:YciI family protein n=1 Tax=Bacillus cytotoxicus TaxID=580165 RepID=UPI003B76C07E
MKPLNVVENFLQEHVDFLDKHYKRNSFIFSGRRDPRIGGVILVNSDDEVAVQEILMEDPFYNLHLLNMPTSFHHLLTVKRVY